MDGGETFYSGELELADDGKTQYENKIPIVKDARDNIKSYSLTYLKIVADNPKIEEKTKEEVRRIVIKNMLEENQIRIPQSCSIYQKKIQNQMDIQNLISIKLNLFWVFTEEFE